MYYVPVTVLSWETLMHKIDKHASPQWGAHFSGERGAGSRETEEGRTQSWKVFIKQGTLWGGLGKEG